LGVLNNSGKSLMTDVPVKSSSRFQFEPSIPLALGMVIPALLSLSAGSVILFFQFTQFNLAGVLRRLYHIPALLYIQLPAAAALIGIAWYSPRRSLQRLIGFAAGALSLPSLISGILAVVTFPLFSLGYVYADGCGELGFEAPSPDGSQVARVYSGIGPAGFGPCNYVYIYYPAHPYLRRDVYTSGDYWDTEAPDLIAWRSESVLYLAGPDTEIDLKRDVGDLPVWAGILRALIPIP
jgi:hypothetical protein